MNNDPAAYWDPTRATVLRPALVGDRRESEAKTLWTEEVSCDFQASAVAIIMIYLQRAGSGTPQTRIKEDRKIYPGEILS
jgi:hypothetical protein